MSQRFYEKGQGIVGEKSFCTVWRTAKYSLSRFFFGKSRTLGGPDQKVRDK
jgi:hypothetical protein